MRFMMLAGVLVTVLGLLAAPAAIGGDERPPVFSDLTYEKAMASAKEQKRVLLVKATAVWCGPCKKMDRTTWRDEKVVAWVKEHAIAIQIDVDEQPELAKQLRIRAMPTTIGYLDGVEVDREVGFIDAPRILAFGQVVTSGKKREIAGVDAKGEFVEPTQGERVDVDALMNSARRLADDGKDAAATSTYVWLWKNMLRHKPSMVGVRGSFMAGDMKRLAQGSDEARTKFAALRDETEEALRKGGEERRAGMDLRDDWIVLNGVLDDDERTLAWFDTVKNELVQPGTRERINFRIVDMLVERKRWKDIALVHPDPIAVLNQSHRAMVRADRAVKGEQAEELRELHAASFRDTAGMLYASMLAGGREEDARKTAERALKLMDSGPMRTAMVRWAMDAKQPREAHRQWLKEAGESGEAVEGLQKSLEAAIKDAGVSG